MQTQLFPVEPVRATARPARTKQSKPVTIDSVVIRSNQLMRPVWAVKPTTQSYRLLLAAIAAFDQFADDKAVVQIERSTLCDIFEEFESAKLSRSKLKSACSVLMTLQFHYEGEEKGDFKLRNAIEDADFSGGVLTVKFNKGVVPHLMAIGHEYTAARLRYLREFKTPAQFVLYDVLALHARQGMLELALPDLRRALYVKNSEYQEWDDFHRKVLKPAAEEVNARSDLRVNYTLLKKNREVSGVRFEVIRRIAAQDPIERAVIALLVKRGVNEKVAQEKVFVHRTKHCLERIAVFQMRQARLDIGSPGAYLATLLGTPAVDAEDTEDARKVATMVKVELVMQLFAGVDEATRKLLLCEFEKGLPINFMGAFQAAGPEYVTIRPLWFKFLCRQFAVELLAIDKA